MLPTKALKTIIFTAVELLIPGKCALCRCSSTLGFCINCQKLLPWIECACEICSTHLNTPGICGHCQAKRPVYQDSMIPFRYKPPISGHIQALKYANRMPYAVAMAKMMAQWIKKSATPLPDIIVPMPLHRQRINQRGFNQATEISRILGRQLRLPVESAVLGRVKNTVTQTGLNEKMRRQNMKDAFVVKSTGQPGHVALVDDVVTSGSTVDAASKALVAAGVRRVSVWAIAKT